MHFFPIPFMQFTMGKGEKGSGKRVHSKNKKAV